MKPIALAIALLAASAPALAQEARRQPGAHTHGEGRLAIGIQGTQLGIELEAPANDIVGFEHAPSTAAQKKAIADAKARLAKPGDLFKLSAEAGCKLVSANVEVHGATAGAVKAGAHAGHNHGHNNAKAAPAEAKVAGTAAHAPAEHSEFHVTYTLDCASPGKLRSIDLGYFKAFARAGKLAVTVIGPAGQTQGEATRAKPVFDLGTKP